jgi:inner membrane protein involved in colicin E2 resistance
MNKRYLPSLIIFAKGMMITAIGVLFKFLHKGESNVLLGIGGFLIFAALVVLLVMHLTKPKVS